MIYVIIGASCSGKTSFIKNTWLVNDKPIEQKDLIHYTITSNAILLGRYIENERICGCDRISRKNIKDIVEQVRRLVDEYGNEKDIVLDGDRITLSSIMDGLLSIGNNITMLLITCSQTTSINRNLANGFTNTRFHKAVCTKAMNLFKKYSDKVDTAKYIFTDNFVVDDFIHFDIKSLKDFKQPDELLPKTLF